MDDNMVQLHQNKIDGDIRIILWLQEFSVTGSNVWCAISNEATTPGFIQALVSDCLQRLEGAGLKVKLLIS